MAKFVFNFKKQFAPMVRDGSKLQTIRANRADKKRPVPGDIACLYTGLRTKKTQLLREAVVNSCKSILMDTVQGIIVVDGLLLSQADALAFATADGFATRLEMFTWFEDQYMSTTFKGFVTTWAPLSEVTP